jgi:hypothetical protein
LQVQFFVLFIFSSILLNFWIGREKESLVLHIRKKTKVEDVILVLFSLT